MKTFARTAKTAEQLCTQYEIDTRGLSPAGFFRHLRREHDLEHGMQDGSMIYCASDAKAAAQECKRFCATPAYSGSLATRGIHAVDPSFIAQKQKSRADEIAKLKADGTMLEPKDIGVEFGRTDREKKVGSSLVSKLTRQGLEPAKQFGRRYLYKREDVVNALELLEDAEANPRRRLTPNK